MGLTSCLPSQISCPSNLQNFHCVSTHHLKISLALYCRILIRWKNKGAFSSSRQSPYAEPLESKPISAFLLWSGVYIEGPWFLAGVSLPAVWRKIHVNWLFSSFSFQLGSFCVVLARPCVRSRTLFMA